MSDISNVSSSDNRFKKNKYSRQRSNSTPNNLEDQDDFFSKWSPNQYRQRYVEELKTRQRYVFIFALMILILFQSIIAIVAVVYSYRANRILVQKEKKILKTSDLKDIKRCIKRSHYINLAALILNTFSLLCYLIITTIYLINLW